MLRPLLGNSNWMHSWLIKSSGVSSLWALRKYAGDATTTSSESSSFRAIRPESGGARPRIARSKPSSAKSMLRLLRCVSTVTPGYRSRNFASSGRTRQCAYGVGMLIRRTPAGVVCSPVASRSASARCPSASRHCSKYRFPASVSRICRVVRTNNCTPRRFSSPATERLTAAGFTLAAAAAAVKLSSSAARQNSSILPNRTPSNCRCIVSRCHKNSCSFRRDFDRVSNRATAGEADRDKHMTSQPRTGSQVLSVPLRSIVHHGPDAPFHVAGHAPDLFLPRKTVCPWRVFELDGHAPRLRSALPDAVDPDGQESLIYLFRGLP